MGTEGSLTEGNAARTWNSPLTSIYRRALKRVERNFSFNRAIADVVMVVLLDVSYSYELLWSQANGRSGMFSPPAEMPWSVKKEIDNKLSLFKTKNLVAPRFHFTTFYFFYCNVV